ncbi:signal transduction histidine kinase [Paenibacillus castaneae]|uniref:sensor histidine kinase n=1 Tax=Paenibacillus castaneae TaxID=474957 RepID=UPI000C9CEB22|nr:HAMP domain-containing sensor histidine kinase [Paenibacillus castaneae]NIK74953.1 signal transduction histidine kinase [Paenibacillus castaneae]
MNAPKLVRGALRIRLFMLLGMLLLLFLPRMLEPIPKLLDSGPLLSSIFSILIPVGVVLFIWRQMGRYVVKPLEAMSAAARKMAGGDLDFELPKTSVREIAEVREALQALGDGLKELVIRQSELEQERQFYIGAIAHDLRTPLFALRGYLMRLERGLASSPEKAARYLSICSEKAEHLERLVSDLFTYVRSDVLEQSTHKEHFEFGPFIHRIVEGYRTLALSREISIKENGPEATCRLEADRHLLERTIGNLIDNSLRHTSSGGTIEIKWHRQPDRIVFSVADTGAGIPEKDLPHIFEPFYRADASRNSETGGTGLGLTIAKRIIQAHGGDLTACNQSTGGTEITGWISTQTPSDGVNC